MHISNITVPHLRAINFNLNHEVELIDYLTSANIENVLIVAGDKPQDMPRKIYRNTSCELLRMLKKELPEIKIYSCIDQYRCGICEEIDYAHDKLEAGSEGFFTQPFFDINYLKTYADILKNEQVYWGLSPVTSNQSKLYWENKNNVVFPSSFEPTMEWNINFALETINYLEKYNTSMYFMPVRVSAEE